MAKKLIITVPILYEFESVEIVQQGEERVTCSQCGHKLPQNFNKECVDTGLAIFKFLRGCVPGDVYTEICRRADDTIEEKQAHGYRDWDEYPAATIEEDDD